MLAVLQDWLLEIPIRMQSTLILGLRGPDTHACPNVKAICRWLRGLAFRPGNPSNALEFMKLDLPPRIIEKSAVAKELKFCSQHFYSHLMHALEVVAYRYPHDHHRSPKGNKIAGHALELFGDMCDLMHLPIESQDAFERRLGMLTWPGGKQPNDIEEAAKILEGSL